MKLLKLVIVDDEPILLQGLVKTYNWNEMGFEVAGQAQSGEQAIEVIKKVKPHVVLTDIRMKQVSGLMVMEEIQKRSRRQSWIRFLLCSVRTVILIMHSRRVILVHMHIC